MLLLGASVASSAATLPNLSLLVRQNSFNVHGAKGIEGASLWKWVASLPLNPEAFIQADTSFWKADGAKAMLFNVTNL